ncbi:DUF3043 domain-containing protein [Ruicaihuangia caeni]|uniref:DUF3043 domain-containing protein n=1 Tax=Ruicaihuangia caeni TaxID=3042517 RepID=A0AAW6T818_9MICO|nr:DUF3043 domain-containing protein [Klugiella sp. YN-L-19]MDI2098228.1 DUF3043 domain-containing protein [Klugiella sp. YN-L-19]
MAKTTDRASHSPADKPSDEPSAVEGKGRPTPSRRQQEAARKRPLVADQSKEARREARAKLNVARERARIGLANGEERYLPERDRGPQKRWVRDYVDARFSVGEFLIPLMLIVLVITFVQDPMIQLISMVALWVFFGLAVLDSIFLGWQVRRKLSAKFGADRLERGVRWYAAMRGLQMRVMRLPKPQVKRGQYPE